jgi:hypothetical protein
LATFPVYLHKILKVVLHFWGSGGGPLSVVSFLFTQYMILHLVFDCLDPYLKSIYKVFAVNYKLVNTTNLQQIEFLKNCVVELYGVDLSNAYQHVFTFINQLGMVLRRALTSNTKVSSLLMLYFDIFKRGALLNRLQNVLCTGTRKIVGIWHTLASRCKCGNLYTQTCQLYPGFMSIFLKV